jgi:hypothetical protein
MRRIDKRRVLALGALLTAGQLAAVAPAEAGLMAITQATILPSAFYAAPGGTGDTNVDNPTNFLVSAFDGSLGTLTAINFDVLSGAIPASVIVDNNSPFIVPFISGKVSSDATITVKYFNAQFQQVQVFFNQVSAQLSNPDPFSSFTVDTDGGISDFTGSDAATFTGVIPKDFHSQNITAATVLDDFTTSGFLQVGLDVFELSGNTFPGLHDMKATYGASDGTLSVSYVYTPAAAVPEPNSLVLLLMGLIGLGAVVRCGALRRSDGERLRVSTAARPLRL